MPTLVINTNVSKDKIPASFLETTAKLVADLLSKPISYVVVHIVPDQMMMWGGKEGLCALANLGSIGNLGRSQNAVISKSLSAHLEKTLGVKNDRLYIMFEDLKRENVGYAGTTFADM